MKATVLALWWHVKCLERLGFCGGPADLLRVTLCWRNRWVGIWTNPPSTHKWWKPQFWRCGDTWNVWKDPVLWRAYVLPWPTTRDTWHWVENWTNPPSTHKCWIPPFWCCSDTFNAWKHAVLWRAYVLPWPTTRDTWLKEPLSWTLNKPAKHAVAADGRRVVACGYGGWWHSDPPSKHVNSSIEMSLN